MNVAIGIIADTVLVFAAVGVVFAAVRNLRDNPKREADASSENDSPTIPVLPVAAAPKP